MSNDIFALETMKSLDELFQESDLGRQVVQKYALKKELQNSDRNKICNVIITELLNRCIRYCLKFSFLSFNSEHFLVDSNFLIIMLTDYGMKLQILLQK